MIHAGPEHLTAKSDTDARFASTDSHKKQAVCIQIEKLENPRVNIFCRILYISGMAFIRREELSAFLAVHDNRFINVAGMEIAFYEESGIGSSLKFYEEEENLSGPVEMSIHTSEESLDDFISGYELKDIGDMYMLDYGHSWRRYLNGYAEIAVEHQIIEASLIFRLYKSRTLVTSLEMHFYDEVSGHLTMPEEFLDYLVKHERSLQAANEYMYKY